MQAFFSLCSSGPHFWPITSSTSLFFFSVSGTDAPASSLLDLRVAELLHSALEERDGSAPPHTQPFLLSY